MNLGRITLTVLRGKCLVRSRQVCAREESSRFASEEAKMDGCRRVPQEVT